MSLPASSSRTYDVAILGGGMAGLTLAMQLKQAQPDLRLLVMDKRPHPVPETAFKVGESTVELGTHYLSEVLGLRHYLQTCHLPKAGVRCFWSDGDNRDIARRVELGGRSLPLVPSYHLDRGRFENALRVYNLDLGVTFWDACRVQDVVCGTTLHTVRLQRYGETMDITARWLVDASGRAGLLKRRLGLAQDVAHQANAVWFRMDQVIDPDTWSENVTWRSRVPSGLRRISTNHFMGRGYWVWFIPLVTGATSVGIVTDPTIHPWQHHNRFDRMLHWLETYEPQCAQVIASHRGRLQDFHGLKRYAYACQRVFSPARWCLTGEAGVFADPLYSPGADFIGIGNSLITDLIVRESQGESIAGRVQFYNRLFLELFAAFLPLYEGQYPLLGQAQVMIAKIVWDFAIYWGVIARLFFRGKFCDLAFMAGMRQPLQRLHQLNTAMQQCFRVWAAHDHQIWQDAFIDILDVPALRAWHVGLLTVCDDIALRQQMTTTMETLEALAQAMAHYAGSRCPAVHGLSVGRETFAHPMLDAALKTIWLA